MTYESRVHPHSSIVRRGSPILCGDDGYFIIENFFDIELIRKRVFELKDAPEIYKVMEPDSTLVRSILAVHFDPTISRLLPHLKSIISAIIGPAYIHQSRVNFKFGKESTGWHWHSDFETWHCQDGMPEPNCFSVMIPLDENTIENGCLQVIPGSHKWYISTKKSNHSGAVDNFANQIDGVPEDDDIATVMRLTNAEVENVTCSPGDLVVFDSNLLHKSNANQTDGTRANLYFVINSTNNRLIDIESPRPEEMGHRKNLRMI